QDIGVKLDVFEGLPGTSQREFAVGGSVGVVEGCRGGASLRDLAQIVGGERAAQSALLPIELDLLEPHELEKLADCRELSLHHEIPFKSSQIVWSDHIKHKFI